MADPNGSVDYNTLLEWIDTGDRDLQASALENLCMTLLISDNVDRCFENCPPRQFLPALCRIFLDDEAPTLVLEAAARAMTYYMDVSNECSRRITAVEGTLSAICARISKFNDADYSTKELVEQCVKVLEHICQRETGLVYEAGGFGSVLTLVRDNSEVIHKDTLRSAMTVITRLCSKIEPDNDKTAEYSVTLGNLLTHSDLRVSESALRGIAAIVDRFARKRVDPSDFIRKCGLVERLLGLLVEPSSEVTATGETMYILSGKAITFISIVLSLLNNLCRGSAAATDLVVRSPMFLTILKPVMTSADERCVMDGLRLTGMILGLICDGRPTTEKVRPLTEAALSERFTEKHKELVDSIRAKDFNLFQTIIVSNNIDVNYTDDVGQALINWTAAFGTIEMATYLLNHGANVDGGTRSSSLHYAAIFGRPDMTQLLLDHGANPELRDEEGRTALEKARGRKEEAYQKVTRLLEYPMTKSSQNINMCGTESDLFNNILIHLVPIFCTVNRSASSAGISRSTLSLLRKCITKLPPEILRLEVMQNNFNNDFAETFLSMFENTLDRADDPEVREQVLLMMQSVLDRDTKFWREQFSRLGVHETVERIANDVMVDYEEEDSMTSEPQGLPSHLSVRVHHPLGYSSNQIDSEMVTQVPVHVYDQSLNMFSPADSAIGQRIASAISARTIADATASAATASVTDAPSTSRESAPSRSITTEYGAHDENVMKFYTWHDWRVAYTDNIVYIWCDYVAIQLLPNGAAMYVIDNNLTKVALFMPNTTESNEYLYFDRFSIVTRRFCTARFEPLFSDNSDNWNGFGIWDLLCLDGTQIVITNARLDGHKLRLNHDVAGFIYQVANDDNIVLTSSIKLSREYETGFNKHALSLLKQSSQKAALRERVSSLAKTLWLQYLCDCKNNMRLELKELQSNTKAVLEVFEKLQIPVLPDRSETERRLYNNLLLIRDALLNDNSLSIFEIGMSGIISLLRLMVNWCVKNPDDGIAPVFVRVFGGMNTVNVVTRKIVQVMEAEETFPVVRYDRPNSSTTGMKLLTRRFYLKLEQSDSQCWHQQKLVDNTGRLMKTDPLTTVAHFKLYFLQMLTKFWFDTDRCNLAYVRNIHENTEDTEMVFEYTHNFDKNGLLYYIGTNAHTEDKWLNPATANLVIVSSGDGQSYPYDSVEEVFSRDESPRNCHSSDVKNATILMDLGVHIYPTIYTLRHADGYDNSALRTWNFEGSFDNKRWFVISRHENDRSLIAPGDTASWAVNSNVDIPFRFFRIVNKGPNSSGKTHFLSCSGFEIYGNVIGVVVTKMLPFNTGRRPNRLGFHAMPTVHHHSWSYRPNSNLPGEIQDNRADILSDSAQQARLRLQRRKEEKNKNRKDIVAFNPPNAIDISEPPIPLSDNDHSAHGNNRRHRPSAADRYHDAPPNEPKIIDKTYHAVPEIPIETSYPPIVVGYNVRAVSPNRDYTMFGHVVSVEDERVRVCWDNERITSVRYGKRGVYDVGILINQVPKKEPTPEPSHAVASSSVPSSSNAMAQQKSMSTTNLSDERSRMRRIITTANQAASAESLQHQTPSLENLIIRSRVFVDRIPEVRDEQSPSDTPEPSNTDENASVSVAASTFGGGSHPVLSNNRRVIVDESALSLNSTPFNQHHEREVEQVLRHRHNAAPESSQELFNEEDEADLETEDDDEEDEEAEDEEEDEEEEEEEEDVENENEEYYVYQVNDQLGANQHDNNSDNQVSQPQAFENYDVDYMDATPPQPNFQIFNQSRVVFADTPQAGAGGENSSNNRSSRVDYANALRSVMQQVMEASGADGDEEILFNDDFDEEEVNDPEFNEVLAQGLSAMNDHDGIVENIFYPTTYGNTELRYVSQNRLAGSSDAARAYFSQYINLPSRVYDAGQSANRDPDYINHGPRSNRKPLRFWDDDFTLKPAYSALIPVFDPRPGRHNVNQTQDVELPNPATSNEVLFKKEIGIRSMPAFTVARTDIKQREIKLFLRGPNLENIQNVTIEMDNDERKFVYYVQKLLSKTNWQDYVGKKGRPRIWDPTFTIIYELNRGQMNYTFERSGPSFGFEDITNGEAVCHALDALSALKDLNEVTDLELNQDQLVSEKLTQKVNQILSDPLIVAGDAIPAWVEYLMTKDKYLFDLELRRKYHAATAFGTARSIVWTQTQLDHSNEQNSNASGSHNRREDASEYRIGRLKHERIKVPRDDELFETALRVFRFHAIRKSVLEVQYIDEEGTGLGPTLEFFALVAAEFQRKSRAIWICDDNENLAVKGSVEETDLGSGLKPAGYYIRRAGGLFPAPIPPNTDESRNACDLFRVLGIFLGKVLQDNRLVDIPLSLPFLGLLINHSKYESLRKFLTLDDFDVIYPEKSRFIRELNELIATRDHLLKDRNSRQQCDVMRMNLKLPRTQCTLDELCLTFVVDPPANVFNYCGHELIPNGSNIDVTLGNVDEYVEKVIDFHLNTGIRPQIDAFREGFNLVCPLSSLAVFTPSELLSIMCGDQSPQWTAEELYKYAAPKIGYTVESTTFRRFVEVLVEMNAVQRKAFLQFATGCSSLPPGGLANLHPPLTIVRKGDSDDGTYPSVNTCVHYLKMPDYSTKEVLRERLFSATLEKGFYLN